MRLEYLVRWRPAGRRTRNSRYARLQRELLAKDPVHVRCDRGRRTDETGNNMSYIVTLDLWHLLHSSRGPCDIGRFLTKPLFKLLCQVVPSCDVVERGSQSSIELLQICVYWYGSFCHLNVYLAGRRAVRSGE